MRKCINLSDFLVKIMISGLSYFFSTAIVGGYFNLKNSSDFFGKFIGIFKENFNTLHSVGK